MNKKQRKNTFRAVLFIGTAVSLWFVPWPIVMAWLAPLPDTVQEQVDKAADYGFDGMIVYVDQKGNPTKWYTSGYKNRESKTPADPHSLFKIASVGKLYTAVVIAKLIRSGRINMDQTLADHFPELVGRIENAEAITIRMMIEHRSGIPNYTDINFIGRTQNRTMKTGSLWCSICPLCLLPMLNLHTAIRITSCSLN